MESRSAGTWGSKHDKSYMAKRLTPHHTTQHLPHTDTPLQTQMQTRARSNRDGGVDDCDGDGGGGGMAGWRRPRGEVMKVRRADRYPATNAATTAATATATADVWFASAIVED